MYFLKYLNTKRNLIFQNFICLIPFKCWMMECFLFLFLFSPLTWISWKSSQYWLSRGYCTNLLFLPQQKSNHLCLESFSCGKFPANSFILFHIWWFLTLWKLLTCGNTFFPSCFYQLIPVPAWSLFKVTNLISSKGLDFYC